MTPLDERLEFFDEVFARARARLIEGEGVYGDSGFVRSVIETLDELEDELLDAINYCGMGLWRIREAKRAARRLQSMEREADMAQQYYVYGEHIVAEIRYNTGRCAVVETACQEVVESCGTPLVGADDPSSVATCAGCLQMWAALHQEAAG